MTDELFGTETLPLFSRTPAKARLEAFAPAPAELDRQMSFAECQACLDTGKVGETYCVCERGSLAKLTDRLQQLYPHLTPEEALIAARVQLVGRKALAAGSGWPVELREEDDLVPREPE